MGDSAPNPPENAECSSKADPPQSAYRQMIENIIRNNVPAPRFLSPLAVEETVWKTKTHAESSANEEPKLEKKKGRKRKSALVPTEKPKRSKGKPRAAAATKSAPNPRKKKTARSAQNPPPENADKPTHNPLQENADRPTQNPAQKNAGRPNHNPPQENTGRPTHNPLQEHAGRSAQNLPLNSVNINERNGNAVLQFPQIEQDVFNFMTSNPNFSRPSVIQFAERERKYRNANFALRNPGAPFLHPRHEGPFLSQCYLSFPTPEMPYPDPNISSFTGRRVPFTYPNVPLFPRQDSLFSNSNIGTLPRTKISIPPSNARILPQSKIPNTRTLPTYEMGFPRSNLGTFPRPRMNFPPSNVGNLPRQEYMFQRPNVEAFPRNQMSFSRPNMRILPKPETNSPYSNVGILPRQGMAFTHSNVGPFQRPAMTPSNTGILPQSELTFQRANTGVLPNPEMTFPRSYTGRPDMNFSRPNETNFQQPRMFFPRSNAGTFPRPQQMFTPSHVNSLPKPEVVFQCPNVSLLPKSPATGNAAPSSLTRHHVVVDPDCQICYQQNRAAQGGTAGYTSASAGTYSNFAQAGPSSSAGSNRIVKVQEVKKNAPKRTMHHPSGLDALAEAASYAKQLQTSSYPGSDFAAAARFSNSKPTFPLNGDFTPTPTRPQHYENFTGTGVIPTGTNIPSANPVGRLQIPARQVQTEICNNNNNTSEHCPIGRTGQPIDEYCCSQDSLPRQPTPRLNSNNAYPEMTQILQRHPRPVRDSVTPSQYTLGDRPMSRDVLYTLPNNWPPFSAHTYVSRLNEEIVAVCNQTPNINSTENQNSSIQESLTDQPNPKNEEPPVPAEEGDDSDSDHDLHIVCE